MRIFILHALETITYKDTSLGTQSRDSFFERESDRVKEILEDDQ